MVKRDLLGTDSALRRYDDLRAMIGDLDSPTPLVRLPHVSPSGVDLFAKLEWMNPFGSVKDRPARWMLEAMRDRGELDGKTIVEPTSGNTGIALAAIASLMGLPMIAVVPKGMPHEKAVLLESLGAELRYTPEEAPPDRHPMDVASDLARDIVASDPDRYIMPNQYENLDNVRAHVESTGPEIWRQTEGLVRYVFAAFGTTGTITGVGRYLKSQSPDVRVVAIEPVVGHRISGLKNLEETSVPGILDRSILDDVVDVDDDEVREVAVRLHREESLFIGASGAAIIAGALRYLDGKEGVAVAMAPDSSQKAITYLAEAIEAEQKSWL